MPDTKHRSDFDTLADDYASFRTSYSDLLFDTIVGYAAPTARLRVLDLACGTGLSTRGFVARGLAVTGVDIAPNMLRAARVSVPEATFYDARAEALPFADGAFGLVTCGQAFHWFDGPAVYASIERVLAPSGSLAMFWKDALGDDPFTKAADDLERQWSGRDPEVLAKELMAGLREEWQAAHFVDRQRHVFDVRLRYTIASFVGYHRSRETLRIALGPRKEAYLKALHDLMSALAPAGRFEVAAKEYVFLGRKSGRA